jgi:hypothetical protein
MSSVVISGDTSGAITLAAPAVAGTNTVTIPSTTGTVMVSGNQPVFSVYSSANQTGLTINTLNKIAFDTELYDSASCFNTSNYRFTPTIAGYYQFNMCVYVTSVALTLIEPFIYKNGSLFSSGQYLSASGGTTAIGTASNIIYCNGSTDYIEFYTYAQGTASYTINASLNYTFASGCLVRTA